MADTDDKTSASRPCPICGKTALAAFRPFCSKRCADIDLGRWLKGGYVIPGEPLEEADDAPAREFQRDH